MASPISAASVILYRHNPRLELFWVKRASHMPAFPGFHAFPGGQIDEGEDAPQCAARELKEETGVDVDADALVAVGRWLTPAFLPRRFDTTFFLAPVPAGATPETTRLEHEYGEWIEPRVALKRWHEEDILLT